MRAPAECKCFPNLRNVKMRDKFKGLIALNKEFFGTTLVGEGYPECNQVFSLPQLTETNGTEIKKLLM